MQGIPQYLKAFYNVECPVSFPVEAEVGKNMLNMSHFKEEDWLNVA